MIAAGPYDGVVQINSANGGGSGSLLYDYNHILTAAHVLSNGQATFNDRSHFQSVPAKNALVPPIVLNVPANGGTNQFQTIDPTYNRTAITDDLAVLSLPDQTPAAGQPAGRHVAPYSGFQTGNGIQTGYQLYSGNDIGNINTLVGYGFTGAGATGETNDEVQQISLTNWNAFTTQFHLELQRRPADQGQRA